jgi:hypothetical protein
MYTISIHIHIILQFIILLITICLKLKRNFKSKMIVIFYLYNLIEYSMINYINNLFNNIFILDININNLYLKYLQNTQICHIQNHQLKSKYITHFLSNLKTIFKYYYKGKEMYYIIGSKYLYLYYL